jgi:hypothetical protein
MGLLKFIPSCMMYITSRRNKTGRLKKTNRIKVNPPFMMEWCASTSRVCTMHMIHHNYLIGTL